MAVVLLVGATLLMASFVRVMHVDLGIDYAPVIASPQQFRGTRVSRSSESSQMASDSAVGACWMSAC
jgi:hypothetical protein